MGTCVTVDAVGVGFDEKLFPGEKQIFLVFPLFVVRKPFKAH